MVAPAGAPAVAHAVALPAAPPVVAPAAAHVAALPAAPPAVALTLEDALALAWQQVGLRVVPGELFGQWPCWPRETNCRTPGIKVDLKPSVA